MDGFKKSIRNSLQARLAIVLSAVLVLAALIAGGLSFREAFHEANEIQDDVLRQVAALIRHQTGTTSIEEASKILIDLDLDIEVAVQALGDRPSSVSAADSSTMLSGSAMGTTAAPAISERSKKERKQFAKQEQHRLKHRLNLPSDLSLGIHTLDVKDTTYRILVAQQKNGQHFAVVQETELRDELAYDSAMRTVMPLLLLIPVLVGLVLILLRTLFAPIKRLSQQIDARDEHDLSPIRADKLPNEIQPFIDSINDLLLKVEQSMQQQRRFVADAAHELRTPMTALSLQAEHLANAPMSELAEHRLLELRQGIERSRRLLEQLLGLARAQEQAQAIAAEMPPVAIRDIYRQVLEELMPLVEAKQIDIGVIEGPQVSVRMNKLALSTIVKNLVDNAIRYTPQHGQIDLSVRQQGPWAVLEVSDSGPGIPAHERERVYDPFYRILGSEQQGSGLGLSIVQTLIKTAGGEIQLLNAAGRTSGLLVRVQLPL